VTLVLAGSKQRMWLPLLRYLPDPTIMVEPQEHADYTAAHPSLNFVRLDEDDRGFGYMMNALCAYTLAQGERYFVFTDDDVTGLRQRVSLQHKFRGIPPDRTRQALTAAAHTAQEEDLAQYAVSFAGQSWGAGASRTTPTGAWGVHVTDAVAVTEVGGYDEDLAVFSDWEMSARLLAAGYRTARTNLLSFVHTMRSEPGGAAHLYAQKERVKASAEKVAARYPDAARVIYVEKHDQYEVRFNWRKIAA